MIQLLDQIRETSKGTEAVMMEVSAADRQRTYVLMEAIGRQLAKEGFILKMRTVPNVLDPEGTEEWAVWCEAH